MDEHRGAGSIPSYCSQYWTCSLFVLRTDRRWSRLNGVIKGVYLRELTGAPPSAMRVKTHIALEHPLAIADP